MDEPKYNRHGLTFEAWEAHLRKRGMPEEYFKDPRREEDWARGFFVRGSWGAYYSRKLVRQASARVSAQEKAWKEVRKFK